MRRLGFVLTLTLVGGGVALADKAAGSASDKSFVDKAATGGMAEVQLSKLAMEKGQSMEVKQFARKMVEDHTKANTELKQIAQKKDITVPTKLDEKHEAALDKLSKLSGAEFDQEYMRVMTQDHDETIKLLKNEAQNGQDPELKSFAMKTLPVVEKHDDMAHMDQKQLGKMKETMPQK
jgi:putative membrane protein